VDIPDNQAISTVETISCNSGYVPEFSTTTCLSSGFWHPTPSCIRGNLNIHICFKGPIVFYWMTNWYMYIYTPFNLHLTPLRATTAIMLFPYLFCLFLPSFFFPFYISTLSRIHVCKCCTYGDDDLYLIKTINILCCCCCCSVKALHLLVKRI